MVMMDESILDTVKAIKAHADKLMELINRGAKQKTNVYGIGDMHAPTKGLALRTWFDTLEDAESIHIQDDWLKGTTLYIWKLTNARLPVTPIKYWDREAHCWEEF
jgi:hypothetical protein